jgi:hypothetical protein
MPRAFEPVRMGTDWMRYPRQGAETLLIVEQGHTWSTTSSAVAAGSRHEAGARSAYERLSTFDAPLVHAWVSCCAPGSGKISSTPSATPSRSPQRPIPPTPSAP